MERGPHIKYMHVNRHIELAGMKSVDGVYLSVII